MAQSYPVTLYYNTGFDRGNIPSSPAVLAKFDTFSADAVFEWQNLYAADIRIKATWDNVKNADYLRLGSGTDASYYIITSVAMLSNLTAELRLTLDPLTTAGGVEAISVVSGWASRAHVSDDSMFGNILPEPWSPTGRMIIRHKDIIHNQATEGAGHKNLVVSTCDLSNAQKYKAQIAEVSDEAGDATAGAVVWPELPSMQLNSGTQLRMPKGDDDHPGGYYGYIMPQLFIFDLDGFDGDRSIKEGVNALRSVGIESAIVSAYSLPTLDIESYNLLDGRQINGAFWYTYIAGAVHNYSPEQPYVYKSVKNKKAIALYNLYTILSVSSGGSAEFEAYELYSGGEAPSYRTKSDPSPNGCCYCQPSYYQGAVTQRLEQAVAGAEWLTPGIMYSEASGATLTLANAQRQRARAAQDYNYRQGMLDLNLAASQGRQDAAGMRRLLGDTTGAVGSIAGGDLMGPAGSLANFGLNVGDYARERTYNQVAYDINRANNEYSYNRAMGDNLFSAQAAANNSAPTLAFPVSINAASYYGNAFLIYHTTLSDNDLARFDDFLSRFGYAVDKKFQKSDLNNRTKCNYIKTSGAQVTSPYVSQAINQLINDMFDSGVRLWHVPPAASAFDSNTIRG